MAVGDVYRIRPVWDDTVTGREFQTHIDVRQATIAAPSIGFVGDEVKQWWDTGQGDGGALKGYYDTTTRLVRVLLRRVRPLEDVEFVYTTGLPIAGTNTGDTLSLETAILVSLRTNNIGRRRRGRMYLPSPSDDTNGPQGQLTATDAEDIADGVVGLHTAIEGATVDYPAVVYSETGNLVSDITEVKVDRYLRSQRRRSPRTPVYIVGA